MWYKQLGYHIAYPGEDPPYPFQCVNYVDGRDTGIMMVIAPFYDTNYYRQESIELILHIDYRKYARTVLFASSFASYCTAWEAGIMDS